MTREKLGKKSDRNTPGIGVLHDSEILVFDVRPPLFSRRKDAYRPPWRALWFDKLIAFYDGRSLLGLGLRNSDRRVRPDVIRAASAEVGFSTNPSGKTIRIVWTACPKNLALLGFNLF